MDESLDYSKELAIKNMRAGVIAGLVIFGISLGKFLIAQFTDTAHPSFEGLNDPWATADLVFLFILIWGVTRYSRASAIILFLYYSLSTIIQFLDTGSFFGLGIASIFLFLFARAIKGTFDYQKLKKTENPEYKSTKKWMWFVGVPVTLILVFILTLGTLAHYEITPASYVKSIQDITDKDLTALRELNLIDESSQVFAYYSDGLFSRREGGVFMTDSEIVVYAEIDGETYYDNLLFDQIDWVKQLSSGNEYEDAIYQVAGRERFKGFQFALSIENNGHNVFIQKLKNKISPPLPKIEIPLPQIDIGQ